MHKHMLFTKQNLEDIIVSAFGANCKDSWYCSLALVSDQTTFLLATFVMENAVLVLVIIQYENGVHM